MGVPLITPTETAETLSLSTRSTLRILCWLFAQCSASTSATYAPVIDAVRVPPSACSTSQSS